MDLENMNSDRLSSQGTNSEPAEPAEDPTVHKGKDAPGEVSSRDDCQLRKELDAIRIQLREKEEDLKEANKRWNDATKKLLTFSLSADTHKLDDSHFKKSFDTLSYKIEDWTSRHFSVAVRKSKLEFWKPQDTDAFSELTRDWKNYLDSDKYRPALIQAHLWKIMYSDIFHVSQGAGALWATGKRKSFRSLLTALSPGPAGTSNIHPPWKRCDTEDARHSGRLPHDRGISPMAFANSEDVTAQAKQELG
jgi:hypothetical protein